ncbi:Uu.00g020440.m01.CDS01 [Anthostomella pinea]|uniref:Uu.00g020440.m01.CDS01 n=1 Tax=Anthostomella pinea TaxID=933095 RepID=A0AAI8YQU4_9PEZI|nr:Uu.00g020440.m01.CDS01 [Anthostomella pinea]
MTTIDEENEMDFINWDAAAPGTGLDLTDDLEGATNPIDSVPPSAGDPNMNLVFEDIDGDDWSFWALEHFESTQMPQDVDVAPYPELDPQPAAATSGMYWEIAEASCSNCANGGYQCKKIREGKYKGYCTSCVALRCECSFGPATNNLTAEAGATFPANPWPVMGDRPATSILHEDELAAMMTLAPPTAGPTAVAEQETDLPEPPPVPKIGARFSRESVKVLKNWLVTHSRHPYPTDEEKDNLRKITGLNKTQITNWLANARRRGKVHVTRSTSPHVGGGYAQAMDIPQRRGTPGPLEAMNPLQRWANSPPENEPASVTAIARAVSASNSYSATSGSGRNSPYVSNFSDDGSGRSLCNQSSASSLGTSHGTSHSSGGSFASAFSNQSRGSFSSVPSFVRSSRGRRRRRRAPPNRADENLSQPPKTFQCTFCTETFRTKHDWQRHEKSLHLSLERWVCSPDGPRITNPETDIMSCVFCGEANPDDAHIEQHNFSGCTERSQEERTFYRKDHLRQHLRLVHGVKFLQWAMGKWQVASPEIRSRCGFCGVVLDSWAVRVDHLAEHYKTGKTMAEWKGDWGFDAPVLQMVENSVPPYLIHHERQTPMPITATQHTVATPSNAYELLKMELHYWLANRAETAGPAPTDAEIQQEACRIIFGAEVTKNGVSRSSPSWLRDLVMSSEETTRNALFQPIRGQSESYMSSLRINGKVDIFENCDLERELQDYVRARQLIGLTAMDHELHVEACRIIGRMEERSGNPSEDVANWLIRLIHGSSTWTENFRQRAHLPRSEDVGDAYQRSKDPKTIDSTVLNFSRLEAELGEYLRLQRSLGFEATDAELQRQARIIVYELDDEWNQTAADDREWLSHFRERHPVGTGLTRSTSSGSPAGHMPPPSALFTQQASGSSTPGGSAPGSTSHVIKATPLLLCDANCYQRLAQNLGRFVASTMSTNNPNCHVPTDAELQHQARWIIYDDDDPWNQTAADNVEWLQRFKVDVGILPKESGPGLTSGGIAWAPSEGGTGFAPPYVAPNPAATMEPLQRNPSISLRDGSKPFQAEASTANHYLQNFSQRYPAPAKIFCSRELETGLTEYVKRELQTTGVFPSDSLLQDRARSIMSMQKTPCDDVVLLGRFKAAIQGIEAPNASAPMTGGLDLGVTGTLPAVFPTTSAITAGLAASAASGSDQALSLHPDALPADMDIDLPFTEQEMNDILQELSNTSPSSQGNSRSGSGSGSGLDI